MKQLDANDAFAQSQVRNILNALTYGTDGYFFVYDYNGINIGPSQTTSSRWQ